MGFLEKLGLQAADTTLSIAAQSLSQLLGLSWSPEKAMKKQKEYNEYIMGLQYDYQQKAAAQEQQYAKDYWDYTNAENQKQHLLNAGLNPALMYGQSGSGGMGASGGAKQASPQQPIGNPIAMGLQAQAQNAQIELMRAQAAKANAEATKISGVDTKETEANIKKLEQDVETAISQGKLNDANRGLIEIETKIKDAYEMYAPSMAKAEQINVMAMATMYSNLAKKYNAEAKNEHLEWSFNKKTFDDRVKLVAAELAAMQLEDDLKQSQINLNEANRKQALKYCKVLVELAEKYESDKEKFAEQVDAQIDRWQAQTDNEEWQLILNSIETGFNSLGTILEMFYPKLKTKTTERYNKKGEKIGETVTIEKAE